MEQRVDGAQIPAQATADHQQPSTGELVKRLSEQVSVLVRDELKLAQLEMTRKGKQAGIGAGMLGGSGLDRPLRSGVPARVRDPRRSAGCWNRGWPR